MTYSRHSFPVNYGGWGGMSVPQRVIDCFLMKDGKKPAESPLYEADLTKHVNQKKSIGDCDMAMVHHWLTRIVQLASMQVLVSQVVSGR